MLDTCCSERSVSCERSSRLDLGWTSLQALHHLALLLAKEETLHWSFILVVKIHESIQSLGEHLRSCAKQH